MRTKSNSAKNRKIWPKFDQFFIKIYKKKSIWFLKNEYGQTVKFDSPYLTNAQTRGFVYIILSLVLMGIMYQFQINFALPIVVGVLHVYTFRTLGGEEIKIETPEPEQV